MYETTDFNVAAYIWMESDESPNVKLEGTRASFLFNGDYEKFALEFFDTKKLMGFINFQRTLKSKIKTVMKTSR